MTEHNDTDDCVDLETDPRKVQEMIDRCVPDELRETGGIGYSHRVVEAYMAVKPGDRNDN